jgi:putative ABC transport system permease protein
MRRGSAGAAIRFAVRTLTRNPGPSFLVVLTLAVAIAATTIVYSALDVLLYFVPGTQVDRLVFVASTDPRPSESQSGVSRGVAWTGVSQPDLADWIARTNAFEEFAGFRNSTATLTGLDAPRRVTAMRATPNLLRLWGIAPAAGRTFRSEDGRAGAEPVAIVTESFWRRELVPQGLTVGESVLLDGVAHTLIGVLSADAGIGYFRDTDLIAPLILDPTRAARDERRMFTIGRLAPGVTMNEARTELETIVAQLQTEYPRTNARTGVVVRPHIEQLGGNIPFLMFLMALMAALVVAVACANVSGIMLAQGAARQRELAIRSALGAGRLDHLTRLMTENLVLAGVAGVVALLLTQWGISAIRWLAGDTANVFGALTLNSRVLLVGLFTSGIVPFGFGLLPASRASRPAFTELKEGTRSVSHASSRRVRQLLVAVQVGCAVVLMVQVSVLAKTGWNLHRADNGFDSTRLLTFGVELPEGRYSNAPSITRFFREALARIEGLPGVTSAALTSRLPIADREVTIRPLVEGARPVAPESLPFAALSTISEDYLRTMRIPIRRGRGLTAIDVSDARPAALVSEEAARRLWPDGDPLGRRLALNSPSARDAYLEVVGIAHDHDASNTARHGGRCHRVRRGARPRLRHGVLCDRGGRAGSGKLSGRRAGRRGCDAARHVYPGSPCEPGRSRDHLTCGVAVRRSHPLHG